MAVQGVKPALDRSVSIEIENAASAQIGLEIDQFYGSGLPRIVGNSAALRRVLGIVGVVAPTDAKVLINGDTGTGKELVARAIHWRSRRSAHAFVSVNCGAISRELIASELFGHEKGAFTGATQRRLGRFELANGGTIFLDEADELLPDSQVALLRVLQEREFERVGGGRPIHVDVRVIAATNRDLKAAVANGQFREDLFYRINVFPIEVPPLRERKDDVLMLVKYFVQRYANRAGKNIQSIDKKALDLLQSYDSFKNRFGSLINVDIEYCNGQFLVDHTVGSKSVNEKLIDRLKEHPGIGTKEFLTRAVACGSGKRPANNFLKVGVKDGKIRQQKEGLIHRHFWDGDVLASDSWDQQIDGNELKQ